MAIVGTRHPTAEGAHFARELARQLTLAGVTILSGGAEGIDTEAHLGALEAKGETVVVAPAGFSAPFPEKNAALFRRIVDEGGAYAALVPDDQPATPAAFFRRNGCLAALAHALVVVQAPWRSGTANTAAWARRLSRPLLVVPSSPWIREGVGCITELRRGALLCDSAKSVLAVLRERAALPVAPTRSLERPADQASLPGFGESPSVAPSPSSIEERMLAAIDDGVRHPDALCQHLGLSAADTQAVILTLRLRGALVSASSGDLERLTPRKR